MPAAAVHQADGNALSLLGEGRGEGLSRKNIKYFFLFFALKALTLTLSQGERELFQGELSFPRISRQCQRPSSTCPKSANAELRHE